MSSRPDYKIKFDDLSKIVEDLRKNFLSYENRLDYLHELDGVILNGNYNYKKLAETIDKSIRDFIGSTHSSLYIKDASGVREYYGNSKIEVAMNSAYRKDNVMHLVEKKEQQTLRRGDPFFNSVTRFSQANVVRTLPLDRRDTHIGCIFVEAEDGNAFEVAANADFLEEYSKQCSIAIFFKRIFMNLEEIISSVTLQPELTIDDYCQPLSIKIAHFMESNFCQILILDGDELELIASSDKKGIGQKYHINECVSGLAVRDQEIKNFKDVKNNKENPEAAKRYQPVFDLPDKDKPIHEICVPFWSETDVAGVINLESNMEFQENEVTLLKIIGNFVGSLLKTVNTIDKLTKQKTLTSQLALLTQFETFTHQVNHDLGNHIGDIRLKSEMALRKLQAEEVDIQYIKDKLALIHETTKSAIHVLDEYAKRIKISDVLTKINIEKMLQEIVNSCAKDYDDKIEYDVKSDLEELIIESSITLKDCFRVVVDNALKAIELNISRGNEKNGRLLVRITQADEKCILVSIKDNGIGMSQEQLEKMFLPGVSMRGGEKEGLGIGLFITKITIESLGGDIWVESEPDKGTTIFIKLTERLQGGECT